MIFDRLSSHSDVKYAQRYTKPDKNAIAFFCKCAPLRSTVLRAQNPEPVYGSSLSTPLVENTGVF